MSVKYVYGDLLESGCEYICHQVNCQGKMNSGVAKQIKDKWSDVFKQYDYHVKMCEKSCLGDCQMVQINKSQFVANLFGQRYYGRENLRYTSYDGIYDALAKLQVYMNNRNCNSVAFPYKMSSDRGGADWNVILTMIESVFKDTNITIEIWQLEQD